MSSSSIECPPQNLLSLLYTLHSLPPYHTHTHTHTHIYTHTHTRLGLFDLPQFSPSPSLPGYSPPQQLPPVPGKFLGVQSTDALALIPFLCWLR